MNPVVDYLRERDVASLQALGIYARWSERNPRKLSLNYDQIEAVNGNRIVEHCRGLVLRQVAGEPGGSGEYEVLAWPLRRFYNLGSPFIPADFGWESARYEEKLDGTCCIVYWDPDLEDWCVATRSVPDADVPREDGTTFADLFWRVFQGAPRALSRTHTHVFELTGPGNQIVVPYDEWAITCLAVVDRASGVETGHSEVRTFPLSSPEAAQGWANEQPGTQTEGLVVKDRRGNRCKIKSVQYLALGKVMTRAGSDVGLVEIALSGTADDVRGFLPGPRRARLDSFVAIIGAWAQTVDAQVGRLLSMRDRKAVALAVQADPGLSPWMGTVMSI
jgi:hypothetical protein